jgi:hypothetical protein
MTTASRSLATALRKARVASGLLRPSYTTSGDTTWLHRSSGSNPTLTSGPIKRFPSRPLFRPSRILAKRVREQSIDDTGESNQLTLADGGWTPSYGIEQLVEFRSRHRFSCFGDTLIASTKGEFDEISDLRSDQSWRFLTRRGERN